MRSPKIDSTISTNPKQIMTMMYASTGFIASADTATVRAMSIARRKMEFALWLSAAAGG